MEAATMRIGLGVIKLGLRLPNLSHAYRRAYNMPLLRTNVSFIFVFCAGCFFFRKVAIYSCQFAVARIIPQLPQDETTAPSTVAAIGNAIGPERQVIAEGYRLVM